MDNNYNRGGGQQNGDNATRVWPGVKHFGHYMPGNSASLQVSSFGMQHSVQLQIIQNGDYQNSLKITFPPKNTELGLFAEHLELITQYRTKLYIEGGMKDRTNYPRIEPREYHTRQNTQNRNPSPNEVSSIFLKTEQENGTEYVALSFNAADRGVILSAYDAYARPNDGIIGMDPADYPLHLLAYCLRKLTQGPDLDYLRRIDTNIAAIMNHFNIPDPSKRPKTGNNNNYNNNRR